MFAVASVADVNFVELADHTVAIVTAIRNAARHTAVNFMLHFAPPLFIILNELRIFIRPRLTKASAFSKIEQKENTYESHFKGRR